MRFRFRVDARRPRARRRLRGAYGAAFPFTDADGTEHVRQVVKLWLPARAPLVVYVGALAHSEE